MKNNVVFLLFGFLSFNMTAQNWQTFGSGMNSLVNAIVEDPVTGYLYAGGAFSTAGGIPTPGIAKWDGNDWSPVGPGISGIHDMVIFNGEIYVTGDFYDPERKILKWDGNSWSVVGGDLNHIGNTLFVHEDALYVGGWFTMAGTTPANRIAKWDGTVWSALGEGLSSSVESMGVFNGELYVGGQFVTAGGNPANKIAKWDGANWSALGDGTFGTVLTMQEYNGELYIGGLFNDVSGVDGTHRIAKWNGNSWSAVGGALNGNVFALGVYDGDLYAGGWFDAIWATSAPANNIAKWDGNSWSAVGSGMGSFVADMHYSPSTLYIGGNFQTSGDITTNGITAITMATPVNNIPVTEIKASIHPNPITSEAVVSLEGEFQGKNIILQVFDNQGQLVRTTEIQAGETRIERGNLSEGLYIYRIEAGNKGTAIGKFVISN